ncbi:hypothetical protein SZN_29605 [Streptomyces zinciresistens K42]|uniref:Uncharacterized protein n=1 Tax=Streptomyces zinciresistens K42 TaxID=700597 RepID=G2GK78_9ACTN|nr:hypothetical protein SZN_29605 [Streptomyces zinciresistens K42]
MLALFFPDLEFGWFQGRPLGIALVVIGAIDLLEAVRPRKPKGFVEELRDKFGLGPRNRGRGREDDRDRELEREFDQEVEREGKYRDYRDL